jgi:Ca2+-binding RTX toxin-like protein
VVASTAGANSYDGTTTSLLVTDQTTSQSVTLHLAGNYSSSTWTVTDDGHGGVNIVDPPAANTQVGPVVVHDPGPAASNTIVASAPNQTLTGGGVSDTFVFNFAGVGKDTVTDFHAAADALQFSSSIFANAQAALNATQDDGHGNTVVAIDAQDTITLTAVLKAQLHVADFHVV